LLKGDTLLKFIDNNERKSIPIDFFKKEASEINLKLNPILDYLSTLEEVYFKGDV